MSERFFEYQRNNKNKAIQEELDSYDISGPDQWREAVDLEEQTPEFYDQREHRKLLDYLDETHADKNKVESLKKINNNPERLEILLNMTVSEQLSYLRNTNLKGYRYLVKRLHFYSELIEGKAKRLGAEWVYPETGGAPKLVDKEFLIDNSNVSKESVKLGVTRDALYAAMQGTPEMAAIKIATAKINEDNPQQKNEIIELFGYYSGITQDSIGQYSDLSNLYQNCLGQVRNRKIKEQNQNTDAELEHRAVLLMTERLLGAYRYNGGKITTSESPYNASFKEAVIAGQLGPKVMRQMRGMRRKIQQTDFSNIQRFVGRSGDNPYYLAKSALERDIYTLKESMGLNLNPPEQEEDAYAGQSTGQKSARVLTDQQNSRDANAQKTQLQEEIEHLNHRFQKSVVKIEKRELPQEEKDLQLQSLRERHERLLAAANSKYETEYLRLGHRTPEELLSDLIYEKEKLNQRYEKNKSLAQKALDLHFFMNHQAEENGAKPLKNLIDWINQAPFAMIKRAHIMMNEGASPEAIAEYAIATVARGKSAATPEELKIIKEKFKSLKTEDDYHSIKNIFRVGNILSEFGYTVSFERLVKIADRNRYGFRECLKVYDLDQCEKFMDQGLNMHSVVGIREAVTAAGHDLNPEQIAMMVAKKIDPSDLKRVLDSLPFDRVEEMIKDGIDFYAYNTIKENFGLRGYPKSHTDLLILTESLKDSSINDFTRVLEIYGAEQVEQMLVKEHLNLAELLATYQRFSDSEVTAKRSASIAMAVIKLDREACLEAFNNFNLDIKNLIWLSEKFNPQLDADLHNAVELFGVDLLDEQEYNAYKKLANGELIPEISDLGVTKTGPEGIAEFRQKISVFRKSLFSDQADVVPILGNPILKGLFKALVRYDDNQWRSSRVQTMDDVLKYHRKYKDKFEKLPEYIISSPVTRINKVDKSETFEFSKDFATRYDYLNKQLEVALNLYEQSTTPFSDLVEQAQPMLDKLIEDLTEKKSKVNKPEALKGIQMRIDSLANLRPRNTRNFTETVRILTQFPEFKDLLLRMVFIGALRKNKGYIEQVKSHLKDNKISVDSISFLLDFVDHIANKETFKKYFTDKKDRAAFNGIVDVKSLENELGRFQNQQTIGTMSMQFVPTRNVLTEFSGDIADACWVGKYNSMLEEFPNISSAVMLQDPGGASERYAGAALLIEANSDSGDKLLVIRGLNPITNVINSLSVEDFYGKFTDWVKKIAAKDGRKAAIVIDDRSGGSATNRPVLFNYLARIKDGLRPVTLRSGKGTQFNGYNIANKCFLIQ